MLDQPYRYAGSLNPCVLTVTIFANYRSGCHFLRRPDVLANVGLAPSSTGCIDPDIAHCFNYLGNAGNSGWKSFATGYSVSDRYGGNQLLLSDFCHPRDPSMASATRQDRRLVELGMLAGERTRRALGYILTMPWL